MLFSELGHFRVGFDRSMQVYFECLFSFPAILLFIEYQFILNTINKPFKSEQHIIEKLTVEQTDQLRLTLPYTASESLGTR